MKQTKPANINAIVKTIAEASKNKIIVQQKQNLASCSRSNEYENLFFSPEINNILRRTVTRKLIADSAAQSSAVPNQLCRLSAKNTIDDNTNEARTP
jgi:hypothetical protein